MFRIAEISRTDDEVSEQVISELQEMSWSIDEKGAVIGPWLAEALNEVSDGEDGEEQGDEDNKDDKGSKGGRKAHGSEEKRSGEG